jgi:hypothetical protein
MGSLPRKGLWIGYANFGLRLILKLDQSRIRGTQENSEFPRVP